MGKYNVIFSCGHSEEKELFGKMTERTKKIEYWQNYGICSKCYFEQKDIEKSLEFDKRQMTYREYKTKYSNYETVPGSYDGTTKTIFVYVPKEEKAVVSNMGNDQ